MHGVNVPDEAVDPICDTFGALLRRLRSDKGVSLRALGLMVHYSKGHLSKLENGVAPASINLAEACDAALSADGKLIAAFLADASRLGALASLLPDVPFDIPPSPSHFTGRAAAVTDVIAAVLSPTQRHRAPAVLIHGMPGIGKTALALHVAHALRSRYPGGCLFASLSSPPEPPSARDMHARLLRRLGVGDEQIPADPGETHALYLSVLYRRPVLIVVDDVTSSEQVAALVSASPACAVIATSRHRLDALDDCDQIRLGALTADDSVALFRAISRRDDRGSAADLARIAAACGGVPLALRVAAARFRQSGQSAADLADSLECHGTTWAELDDGERSVRRVLHTELSTLPESGQQCLAMLGVYPARSAGSHAIAWLSGSSAPAAAAELAGLCRRNLVTIGPDGRASMNTLMRAFAMSIASQLDERSRTDALRRLVAGYARTAAAADGEITPLRFRPPAAGGDVTAPPAPLHDLTEAMAWCRAEAELIPRLCAAAFGLGLDAECWRLAYAMRGYFFAVKAFEPWIASHRVALLAAERCEDPWAQAVTRNNLGMAYVEQRQIAAAEDQYSRALSLFQAIGDGRGVASTLGHQAWASHAAGRHDAAASLAGQVIVMNRQRDDPRSLAIASRTAALAQLRMGRCREALAHLAESQDVLSELDLPLDVAMTYNCMGEVHCATRHLDKAETFHTLAAEHSAACGGRGEQARAMKGLAVTARAAGAGVRAKELYQCAAALYADFDPAAAVELAAASRSGTHLERL
jgi:transcriptional regulator with XRE-family HTH domain/tetratricopeptide (TPR) repeat protein